MKISIIVPVYNVELYLKECLDSIITQDYQNLEIILINDGSTDNSGNICDNYAQIDKRIKVIHQENKGIPETRNIGLLEATGDFISFIDSDDWINQGMFSTFANNLSDDIDVFFIPYPTPQDNPGSIYKLNKEQINEKFIGKFIGQNKISRNTTLTSLWSLCIRRSLIKDLFFIKANYEDVPYFVETLLRARNILIISQKFYNYRCNPNSITRKYNKTYATDWSLVHEKTKNILLQYDMYSSKIKDRQQNTIICIYYHLIKNESLNEKLIIPNPSLKQYYLDNNIDKLLSWSKTLKAVLTKPKLLLIKLGLSNYLLKKNWKKYHKIKKVAI